MKKAVKLVATLISGMGIGAILSGKILEKSKEEKNKKVHNDPMSGKISLTKTIHKRGVSYGQ